ncbi:MAG: MmcQ/YjbR family DNA-binding protein [Candidatus Kapaibacterium sp.]
MNIEELREYCLSQPYTTEDTPFDETTLAFKVGGKIFALTNMETLPTRVNLKCDPERAIELRESYPEVIIPGYHMNKKHWNTLIVDELESSIVEGLVTHSYELVFNSLSKAKRLEITNVT